MPKLVRILMCAITALATLGCADGIEVQNLYFIGDSLIARWNVQESFPANVVHNLGVSGAGISYIEQSAHRLEGNTAVVLIGTNDLTALASDDIEQYCDRYFEAVAGLGAAKTFVISVPPRNFDGDRSDQNDIIRQFNASVRNRIAEFPSMHYVDVYDALIYNGTINPQYSLDGLHLNIYGYEVVADLLAKTIHQNNL